MRFALALMILSSAAQADEAACFGRTYSEAHLDRSPAQQVRSIRARLEHDPSRGPDIWNLLSLRVIFRDDPREFEADTACHDTDTGQSCFIDCDGGSVQMGLSGDGRLRLVTSYLRAETSRTLPGEPDEGGCAEPVTRSIADRTETGGISTTFLLYPRDSRECDW